MGELRRYINLLATMLLGGLWHGAGWTFIIWGGLHGFYLSVNHAWKKYGFKLPTLISWAFTFFAVVMSWVLFRSSNLQDGFALWKSMLGFNGIVLPDDLAFLKSILGLKDSIFRTEWSYLQSLKSQAPTLLIMMFFVIFFPNTEEISQKIRPNLGFLLATIILGIFSLLSMNKVSEFLYFQF